MDNHKKAEAMKKYVVVRNSCLVPDVRFQSDVREDAKAWAEIMSRNEGGEYVVFEMMED